MKIWCFVWCLSAGIILDKILVRTGIHNGKYISNTTFSQVCMNISMFLCDFNPLSLLKVKHKII